MRGSSQGTHRHRAGQRGAPTRSEEEDVHSLKKVPTQRLRVTLTFPSLTSATPAANTPRPPPGTDQR